MNNKPLLQFLTLCLICATGNVHADVFVTSDVFGLEYADDPQIAPAGDQVVYVRKSMDIMKDRSRSNLWIVDSDGGNHRAIASGSTNFFSPRWSPDGRQIAFTMAVPAEAAKPFGELPKQPEGAEWAPEVRVITTLNYRADGQQGFLPAEYEQVFVIPADGGTPRQLTSGNFNHGSSLSWSSDSKTLYLAANRAEDWEYEPRESDIYAVSVTDGAMTQLTRRTGPDHSPVVSPDGRMLAYLGFDDHQMMYANTGAYVMDSNGANSRLISAGMDQSIDAIEWAPDGKALIVQYDQGGETRIAQLSLSGELRPLAENTGGTSLDRPYAGGSFSVADNGAFPWEDQAQYWRRSPLSLVGNVSTPTLLLTGESDYRTPIGESEQFYLALKLRKVDTAMVRVPEASHGIAERPSHLIAKVVNILGWFEQHKQ